MDGKALAQFGAIIFVAIALTATAVEMTRPPRDPSPLSPRPIEQSGDPLRAEQRRCQQLGQAAVDNARCMQVWAETRDRFLGRPAPAPIEP